MVDVDCPADDCDYSGPVSSVEGHISGSTNGWHSGRQGRQYRDVLADRAEGAMSGGGSVDVGASDETSEDTSEEAGTEAVEAGESGDSEMPAPTTSAATAGAAGLGLLGSVDLDVSPAMLIGGLLLVLLVYATLIGPASGAAEADGGEVTSEETEQRAGGGLAGA